MSTLPAHVVSGGHGPVIASGLPLFDATMFEGGPPVTGGLGGSFDSGTSMNTSKKLLGAIEGILKPPIVPNVGANAPNSCEFIWPVVGAVGTELLGFVQRTWKRMSVVPETFDQPIVLGVGFDGGVGAHWQANEQM